eukprot:GILK01009317.1.p1 GENE.GILK01009317.1~~GILK01009317.1.p1  ORF type:complete len:182 (-),score=28.52 GILK01009317.1:235-780(-)
MTRRVAPSILITGTPGVGKTSTTEQIVERLQAMMPNISWKNINVGNLIKEKHLYSEWNEEFNCSVFDEDMVVDELEDVVHPGAAVVDFHSCDFFPERWFDLVVVLTSDTNVLFSRLEKRGYAAKKIQENIECEIMRVCYDEAQEAYSSATVLDLSSNSVDDLEKNVQTVAQWVFQYMNGPQ